MLFSSFHFFENDFQLKMFECHNEILKWFEPEIFLWRMQSFVQKWNCSFLLNLTNNNPNLNSNKKWLFSLFQKIIIFIAAITLVCECVWICLFVQSKYLGFGWFVYRHTIFELWMFRNEISLGLFSEIYFKTTFGSLNVLLTYLYVWLEFNSSFEFRVLISFILSVLFLFFEVLIDFPGKYYNKFD